MADLLPSGLPTEVDDNELLARFIYDSIQVNRLGAKPSAFKPPPNLRLSVARKSADPLMELVQLAASYRDHKPAHGAAMVMAGKVRLAGLDIQSSEPPHRHAVILGWPVDEDEEEQRSKRLEIALALSTESKLILF